MSFPFPGFTPDPARHARLVQLSPAEAARALLEGDFMPSDEPALGFVLRKDPRITLDDDAIMDVWTEAYDELYDESAEGTELSDYLSPQDFLDRLVAASQRPAARRRR